MNDPRRDMIRTLEARGPHPSLGEQAEVFDRFVGTWDANFAHFEEDGSVARMTGEVIFGWILDGRAVQDIWIWFKTEGTGNQRTLGTTLRFFDPNLDKWRIVWVAPDTGVIRTLTGGAVGKRIVLEGAAEDGSPVHWSFNDIAENSFVWRSEKSADGGKTWRLTAEYQMRRHASGRRRNR